MDLHVLRPDPDRNPHNGGETKVIQRLAQGTIYSRRWVIDFLLFLCIIVLSVILLGTRSTYNKVVNIGEENHQLLQEVKSCTDPTGACAKRGQQSTATAVERVKQITILASFCASKQPPPVDADQVRACVETQLKQP
jgi:hypothetical protein